MPNFVSYDDVYSDNLYWVFSTTASTGWQVAAPNPAGDTGGGQNTSISADPLFVDPIYPFDNYQFTLCSGVPCSGVPAAINFSTTSFAPTYTSGRNVPRLFVPAVAAGFPMQPLSPFQF